MYLNLEQGDPLSPFLFIIAMEGLHLAIKSACNNGLIHGFETPNNGPCISHLFYADDALIVGKWSSSNLKNITRILKCFHVVSGLKVNFNKSKMYGLGISENELTRSASYLYCEPAKFPFSYLGVPVGANMGLAKNWTPILERVNSKLNAWKAKTLSFAGRITLAKSVLGSLPIYYFSIFKAPKKVIDSLESMRRRFVWGGDMEKKKICWVSWSKVMAPKEKGGLGLGSLRALNLSLLVKWWWRYKVENDSLWRKVIQGLHKIDIRTGLANRRIKGTWLRTTTVINDLEELQIDSKNIFQRKLGDGGSILFWKENWCGSSIFQDRFPNLYRLSKQKSFLVSQIITSNGPQLEWFRMPRSCEAQNELSTLNSLLNQTVLSNRSDVWVFSGSDDGRFTVAQMRGIIESRFTSSQQNTAPWIKIVPPRINCFIWRAKLSRIATLSALASRGISGNSQVCRFCERDIETADHVLISCQSIIPVWSGVLSWCKLSTQMPSSFTHLFAMISSSSSNNKESQLLHAICYATIWQIWKTRNGIVFNNGPPLKPSKIMDEVISLTYLWYKHRGRHKEAKWDSWRSNPLGA